MKRLGHSGVFGPGLCVSRPRKRKAERKRGQQQVPVLDFRISVQDSAPDFGLSGLRTRPTTPSSTTFSRHNKVGQ